MDFIQWSKIIAQSSSCDSWFVSNWKEWKKWIRGILNPRSPLWLLSIRLKQTGSHTRLTILISSNQKTQETTAVQTGSRIKLCSATSYFCSSSSEPHHHHHHHRHQHYFLPLKHLLFEIFYLYNLQGVHSGRICFCGAHFPDRTIQPQNALNNYNESNSLFHINNNYHH